MYSVLYSICECIGACMSVCAYILHTNIEKILADDVIKWVCLNMWHMLEEMYVCICM